MISTMILISEGYENLVDAFYHIEDLIDRFLLLRIFMKLLVGRVCRLRSMILFCNDTRV